MKKIKKFGFVAPILIVLLLVVITSYFVEGRSGISYIAIGDLLIDYVQSYYYFFDTILFILTVGGLYGALNKVSAYKKLVKSIASKVEARKQLFVIISTIVFVLLTSIGGFNLLALIFIPFVISIILLLGYDKLVALSSTVVATMVGIIGGLFFSFRDGTNQYASSFTTFDKVVGLKNIWENVFPKVLLLVLGTGLLIFFIIKHIKSVSEGEKINSLSNDDVFFIQTKTRTGKAIEEDYSSVKVWPFIVFGCLLFVILVLGYMPWNSLFGFDCFNKFHTWLTGLKIGKYVVFTSLISKNITALGNWGDMGSYLMAIVCISLFLLIIKLIYRVRFKDLTNGFVYGVKKMVPGAMILALAYTVLVAAYNNGFIEAVITNAGDSFGDNVIVASLITIIGSIINVDVFYIVAGVIFPIVGTLTDKADLNVYATLFQSFYGLIQICGPTSIMLIIGLSYLDVPYSKWLKYIWRFVLELFILIFIVLIITSLI